MKKKDEEKGPRRRNKCEREDHYCKKVKETERWMAKKK